MTIEDKSRRVRHTHELDSHTGSRAKDETVIGPAFSLLVEALTKAQNHEDDTG
jgi:hypothetical protein